MNIADELSIPGNLEQVYSNLIDPEILKRCIPGCEELEKLVKPSIQQKWFENWAVKAKFSGNVTLDTKAAPTNLSLEGAGDGGLQVLPKVVPMLSSLTMAIRPFYATAPKPKLAVK